MAKFNQIESETEITVAAIIPVFKDDRIDAAVRGLINQVVPFDRIIIQDPVGNYGYLEKLSENIIDINQVPIYIKPEIDDKDQITAEM